MHPAQIQAALKMRESSQAEVARACNVTRTTVNAVVSGRSRSARIERRIALTTGLPLNVLWPQWYGESPRRLPLSPAAVLAAVQAVA